MISSSYPVWLIYNITPDFCLLKKFHLNFEGDCPLILIVTNHTEKSNKNVLDITSSIWNFCIQEK